VHLANYKRYNERLAEDHRLQHLGHTAGNKENTCTIVPDARMDKISEQPQDVGEVETINSIKPNISITLSEKAWVGFSADATMPLWNCSILNGMHATFVTTINWRVHCGHSEGSRQDVGIWSRGNGIDATPWHPYLLLLTMIQAIDGNSTHLGMYKVYSTWVNCYAPNGNLCVVLYESL